MKKDEVLEILKSSGVTEFTLLGNRLIIKDFYGDASSLEKLPFKIKVTKDFPYLLSNVEFVNGDMRVNLSNSVTLSSLVCSGTMDIQAGFISRNLSIGNLDTKVLKTKDLGIYNSNIKAEGIEFRGGIVSDSEIVSDYVCVDSSLKDVNFMNCETIDIDCISKDRSACKVSNTSNVILLAASEVDLDLDNVENLFIRNNSKNNKSEYPTINSIKYHKSFFTYKN